MPNMSKRGTQLVKTATKKVNRTAKSMAGTRIAKLAAEGARVAGEAYDAVKTTVARVKRRRAVRRVAKDTMDVAREATKAAVVTAAVTAAVATARIIRKRKGNS